MYRLRTQDGENETRYGMADSVSLRVYVHDSRSFRDSGVPECPRNLMNTLSRFPYPRLRIALDTLGARSGEKTSSLRFSQPSGTVTITLSKEPRNPSAASISTTPTQLL